MKTVMMRKAKLTPVDKEGNKMCSMTLNMDQLDNVTFVEKKGKLFMNSPAMRNEIELSETMEQINRVRDAQAKPYKIRSTTQIVIEGNNDL